MERKLLEPLAERLEVRAGNAAEGGRDLARKGGRQPGDDADGAAGEAGLDQSLRPDEDIEAVEQVRLEAVPRLVGHLQPDEVRGALAKLVEDRERNGVAASRGELVDVEGERLAGLRRGNEVRQERPLVESEVRRSDHGDRVGPEIGRVRGQLDRFARGLGAAVDGNRELIGPGRHEQLGRPSPLRRRQQNSLAGRPQREQPVEAAALEKRDERVEAVLVEDVAAARQRRHGSCKHAFQHDTDFKLLFVGALRIEREGPVLRVMLARPEQRNAFDAELIRELTEAFADVGDARAIVLSGEGKSFCAGADVDWQRSAIDLSYDENVEDALCLYRMLEAIDSCPAPVVARVQGYALGGGSGLVCCADVAIAAPDATFGFSEVKLGIVPAVISPFVFPRIGTAAARRYFLTGEQFDAETALRIGLVHEVVADLDAALERVLGELMSAGPEATRAAKKLIRDRPGGAEAAQLAAKLRTSSEGQEGLRAFLDKRPAAWRSESSS